ncbi:hypothetical protein CEUSTIGMA_g8936.t1 [Chlamydomonas eustigma]|uniref:3'-5' exonuclease domain-containing protein n=1 Tax=Chlamydomonas eustigma TaxID=1157962 RepID=A0A250XEJ5_9CHLO|nr:hypothetical protein CEUSTIGMA_g8936.t1 [Chlamydomonas eustigma]|eukprot:GAX81508.1 hypothetical protein CEUSTIGMA_g8936.t1 [Chlamydomonas eustigma]
MNCHLIQNYFNCTSRHSTKCASLPLSKVTSLILQNRGRASAEPEPSQNLEQYDSSAPIKLRSRDFQLVETPGQLQDMLKALSGAHTVAMDCEGVNLGHTGKLCLLQLAARKSSHAGASSSGTKIPLVQGKTDALKPASTPPVIPATRSAASAVSNTPVLKKGSQLQLFIVDIHKLQWRAFHYRLDPTDPSSLTLKSLLESSNYTKLVYDVRSDASNLLQQFDVRLRSMYDLQLAEVAVRQMRGVPAKWVLPLEKSLSNWLPRSSALEQDMLHGHYISKHYHQGNRMEVWQERPLKEELLHYAAADVRYLHLLQDVLDKILPPPLVQKVYSATISRIRTGNLPGLSRSSAPDIVRPSDVRQLTEQLRQREVEKRGELQR